MSGKNKVNFIYLLSLAFKNILSHKRHMIIIIFGFTISISVLLSVNLWSNTSENLAINDFLGSQDYQAYIFSASQPEDIDEIIEDLDDNTLVDFYSTGYSTAALFNTEGKDNLTYECLPENDQTDPNDPVSLTNAFITGQETLERISYIFNIEGNFSVEDNGILLSHVEAQELSVIYGRDIQVGDVLNLSIGKYIPNIRYGEIYLSDFQATYYQNYTVNGIYTINEGVSIIQHALSSEVLSDSIIFPLYSLGDEEDIMKFNSVPYVLFVKFDRDEITKDGLDEVINKMNLFSETIKRDYPTSYIYIIESILASLTNAYSRASVVVVLMIPVIIVGIVMTIFTINIVIDYRQTEVALLRDRGADTVQILLLFIIEFTIVALFGIILGIVLSFFIAAFIPSFTASGFNGVIFRAFLLDPSFSYGFTIGISFTFLIVLLGYASLKIWWEISLRHKSSEHDLSTRRKMEKNVFIGANIVAATIVVIALIIALIDTIKSIQESQNFSISSTTSAGYTFVLLCFLLIFIVQIISYLITDKFQVSLKGLYRRLIFNEAFFLINNFKRKDKKLSTMSFAIILVTTFITFSLISASSVTQNQLDEANYKNGADMRVITYPVDYNFRNNISQIDGINEVVALMKTTGSIAYDDYTIVGVDSITYSRVGKWDSSSFAEGNSFENLKLLDETYDGIIIGQALASRLNLTIGDNIPIINLPGGLYHRSFVITGILNSAPGLGLLDGKNIEMLQQNNGIVLINEELMLSEFGISNCQLFLANVFPDENETRIKSEIEGLLTNIQVNPELINEQFIGAFIESYIPNVRVFFYVQLLTISLIIVILIVMYTDFTLNQRTQEFAITQTMGKSRTTITKLLVVELIVIVFSAYIGGLLLGLAFTYASFNLMVPILTSHNIIPFSVSIPILQFIFLPILFTTIALIGVLPSIVKYGREKIINALRS
ncbi:MAG: FtsX-like permease family protein [Asgard group archaeon]|nr:FtsX-like permease family protein [Asgard group archaeon]